MSITKKSANHLLRSSPVSSMPPSPGPQCSRSSDPDPTSEQEQERRRPSQLTHDVNKNDMSVFVEKGIYRMVKQLLKKQHSPCFMNSIKGSYVCEEESQTLTIALMPV